MKRAIVITAFVVAALGAIGLRAVLEGRAALRGADAAIAAGRPLDAIRAYESAARWYVPLAPHVDEAYRQLRHLGETGGMEEGRVGAPREKIEAARQVIQLAAWRSIRGAARATRSLWTPHADDLALADAAIAKLSTQVPGAATPELAWHVERLAADPRPGTGPAVLAAVGLLVWLLGAFVLARRGLAASGRLVPRWGIGAGAASLLGLVCWVLGLYNA